MTIARVYFKSGQYASVEAECVFEAVAQSFSARALLRNLNVEKVELDVMHRYRTEPDYV